LLPRGPRARTVQGRLRGPAASARRGGRARRPRRGGPRTSGHGRVARWCGTGPRRVSRSRQYVMPRVAGLRSIDEALALVLERVRPLPAEDVPLADAAGRVLAKAARAVVDLPPFPSSAMDGFALRAEDVPGRLPIGARIAAGRPAPGALEPGTAMAIATGGVVPEGADCVVPIELVVADDQTVEIPEPVKTGANVRPRGGDTRAGEQVVAAGVRLGPAQVGALAAAGIASLRA